TSPALPDARIVDTGEIELAVYEQGDGPPLILVHGFPELAYSWRHQLPAFAEAGYRAIALDMRGYGGSDKPPHVTDYTIQKLIGDVKGLMGALSIEKAVIVGHDWGALVTWQMALLESQLMAGLVCLNIPHLPRPPINPITYMRFRLGKDFYIVNFQKSDEADRKFAEDPRRFINAMMRRRQFRKDQSGKRRGRRRPLSLLWLMEQEEPGGQPLLSEEELDVYANAFAAGGFTGPINWYRNWTQNWKSTKGVNQVVRVPSLFVGADSEIVISRKQIEAMKPYVEDLEIHMIEDCGHWTQQEKPEELNRVVLDWLARRYPA
ncbi:MAG: alpha/beta fold hydrolase, partial [Woeseiaceae bacterium]|nr:alpha/beta fold hydrolase [Woeseiaceae bacterium]